MTVRDGASDQFTLYSYLDGVMGEERERTNTDGWEPAYQLILIGHFGALICRSTNLLTGCFWCRAFIFLRYNIVVLFLLNNKREVILQLQFLSPAPGHMQAFCRPPLGHSLVIWEQQESTPHALLPHVT